MTDAAKPGKRRAVRGQCRSCGSEYALTVTGRVRMHAVPGTLTECEGSRRAPAQAVNPNRLAQLSIEEILSETEAAGLQPHSNIQPVPQARPQQARPQQARPQQARPQQAAQAIPRQTEPAQAIPQPATEPAEAKTLPPAFVPVHYPDILMRGNTGSGWDNVWWTGQHV